MALIWKTELQGGHYEGRRAGRTLRLYANGVQHSEFHPKRLVTGSVWDLLWLPALLSEQGQFGARIGKDKNGRDFFMTIPWGDIPARPFLGVGPTDRENILETITEYLATAAGD